jgi:aspartyl-tRNA(Asn)/glutamyl-tRNA(Gln) amidotransferase subunit A
MKIAVDENIFIKEKICAAGSKMLYNFKPPYHATVVDKIKSAKMIIACQSKTGEFGKKTTEKEIAAYMVGHGLADAALGIDVEGFAYFSASENDVIYIKPTYGTVSRFGLAANTSSIDQIGVYAKNLADGFATLSAIAGYDKNDPATYLNPKYEYSPDGIDAKSLKVFDMQIEDFKYHEYLRQVYLIISAAEFGSNAAKFDGLKFGYRTEHFKDLNDMIVNSRSESFTPETKLKILMGTYVLSKDQFEKYYLTAAKIRRLIKQELDAMFMRYDIVILPLSNESSALANLSGCPAVIAEKKIILAEEFGENKLFAFGFQMKACLSKMFA